MLVKAPSNNTSAGLHAGMPPLDSSADEVSWFEFAPAHLFYTPIALYCGWLSLKHFGLTLPTNVNPALPYSGLVGESKYTVLNEVTGGSRDYIAPYIRCTKSNEEHDSRRKIENTLREENLAFPLVAKPDIGMRGTGVQVVKSPDELNTYIETFPEGADYLLQDMVDVEGEAGVFYVRHPNEKSGKIISLTLKYFPRVTGDGKQTLRQLIMGDPRAGKLPHLYLDRHEDKLDNIVPDGESVRLAFAGNHCRGTIFRNGNDQITDAMVKAFDGIAKSMGEFYAGRFDVRYADFKEFQNGHGFKIIEVNGSGGEATHIWDSRTTLREAYK
ncbi:MAG: D-alanine--D-alanine ligase, partial [Kordiimonas sp.]